MDASIPTLEAHVKKITIRSDDLTIAYVVGYVRFWGWRESEPRRALDRVQLQRLPCTTRRDRRTTG